LKTTENALKNFGGNQFEMITAAAHRARQIARGSELLIEKPKEPHKPGVLALMEIEAGKYTKEDYLEDIRPKTEQELAHEHFIEESKLDSELNPGDNQES
jgi:DNA-directed RNA polymerase subunit omega